jgi:hypothetical protein
MQRRHLTTDHRGAPRPPFHYRDTGNRAAIAGAAAVADGKGVSDVEEQSMIARHAFLGLIGVAAVLCASTAMAQTARDIRGPAPVVPLASEPAPRIVIDPPLAEWLAQGRVVIQYRAENLRIVPVFGPSALDVSPRIGHIHVTVDDSPWRWADASGEPLIINCLLPGPHRVLIELVNANHQTLERGVVTFIVPVRWSGC